MYLSRKTRGCMSHIFDVKDELCSQKISYPGGSALLVLTLCQIRGTFGKWPKFFKETDPPPEVGPKVPQYFWEMNPISVEGPLTHSKILGFRVFDLQLAKNLLPLILFHIYFTFNEENKHLFLWKFWILNIAWYLDKICGAQRAKIWDFTLKKLQNCPFLVSKSTQILMVFCKKF